MAAMAILRLINGDDIRVKLSVADAVAALTGDGFVELATEDDSVHVRASGVIAVVSDGDRRTTGFRVEFQR